jgi:hypothetical protein
VADGWFGAHKGVTAAGVAATTGLVLAVGAWFFFLRDTATPASVGEAVTSFRQDTKQTPAGRSPVPLGVYVYRTEGYEKTDALTGVTHHYPDTSTITVTRTPCGVQMRWAVLQGRSTTWTFCIGAKGWVVTKQDERHTFFHVTQATTYDCSDVLFLPRGDKPGRRVSATCTTSSATEHEVQWVVAREHVRVEARRVPAVHIRQQIRLTGGSRGASLYDIWLARATGVPVRLRMVSKTTNDSPVGDVHYEEVVTLRLVSLTPKR